MSEINVICPDCGTIQGYQTPGEGQHLQCAMCQSVLVKQSQGNNYPTLILLLAALILYFPANYYPIMSLTMTGRTNTTTIWQGVVGLYSSGMVALALLVFFVSIFIPLLKIIILSYLIILERFIHSGNALTHHKLLRFTKYMGPWSMLDVLLVATLVSVVKLQDFARVEPGPGLVAFAGVVILTIIASALFDSRLLWREKNVK